jgi:hypothetical protein
MDLRRVLGCFGIACSPDSARHVRFPPFSFLFLMKAVHNCGSGPTTILVDPQSCFSAKLFFLPLPSTRGSRLIPATAQDADVMIDDGFMRNAMDWNGG